VYPTLRSSRAGQTRSLANDAAQIATHTERAEAVGHQARLGRNSVGPVLECKGCAIDTKGRALQRTIRNESIFRVLVLLGVLDEGVLRLAIGRLADGTNLESG